jgi:hypothetical protein
LLILQGYIFRTLQHFATKLCNFTNFRMLFCLLSYNDIFRLSCLDKKLVDSCRNCLLLGFMAIIHNFSTLRRISTTKQKRPKNNEHFNTPCISFCFCPEVNSARISGAEQPMKLREKHYPPPKYMLTYIIL